MLESVDKALADRVENYLDGVVPFNALGGDEDSPAGDLLRNRIEGFVEAMRDEYRLDVDVSDALREHIVGQASEMNDAPAIERLITEKLYDPMTDVLLADEVGESARLDWDEEAGAVTVGASED